MLSATETMFVRKLANTWCLLQPRKYATQSAAEAMKDIDSDKSGPDYDARASRLFRSFSPPAGNCLERAFRRTEKRSVQSQELHISDVQFLSKVSSITLVP